MINLPKIIDTLDLLTSGDEQFIDKIASMELQDGVLEEAIHNMSKLSMDKYACIIKTASDTYHKFPINNRDMTALSIAGFNQVNASLPDEIVKVAATNLLKAAYQWGVEEDLDEVKKYADNSIHTNVVSKMNEKAYMAKTASKASPDFKVFALDNRYPIDTPELMKTAEGYFRQYSHKLDPVESYKFATNMIKQAKATGYHLSEKSILKYANLRFERNPDLESLLRIRDSKAETDGAYTKVASVAKKVSLEKMAETVLELDQAFGLDKHYNKIIPDPIFTVFNSLEKTAETIGGKNVTLESLRAIPRESLSKFLTQDTIDDLQGDSGLDVLSSLPEPIIEDIVSNIQ